MIVTAKPINSAHPPAPKRMTTGARPAVPKRAPKPASAPVSGNTFPKSVRLLKHASFQHVYEAGRKQFSASMIFFFVLSPIAEGQSQINVQVGITVGRVLGGAVDRNRIRRRMRDVVRHQLGALQAALSARGISAEIVLNPKKTVLTADIAALRAEVERGFGIIAAANVPAPRAVQAGAAVPRSASQKTGATRN